MTMAFKVIFLLATFSLLEARSLDGSEWASIDLSLYSGQAVTWQALGDDQVCFPDLGCFSKDGPMKHTGILPESLEKINTKFYAYTPTAVNVEHLVDPYQKQTFAPIDASKTLAIIAHGFGNNHNTEQLQDIKNALLQFSQGEVGTVIVVDWAKGAAQPFYNEASTNTQVVGRQIAHLVEQLRTNHSVSPERVYVIGFSLGAQVAGFAGKFSQTQYQWKLGRITGLDAAAPMFENYPGSYLTKEDGEFVDAIHTSIGTDLLKGEIGFTMPYAHVDFFPNGGNNQPWCTILHPACNHYASVLLYQASLAAKSTCTFKAYSCFSWDKFKEGKCTTADSELGYATIKYKNEHGDHYLKTSKKFPYCDIA